MKKTLSIFIALSMLISALLPAGVFAADDVLYSLSFESDSEVWSPWSAAGKDLNSVTTDCATEGKKSFLVNDNDTGKAGGLRTEKISVKAGETYTALADIYHISGTVNFVFRYYDADKKQLTNKSAKGTAGKWVTAAISEVAPADAFYADLIIASNAASKGIAYFDNLRLVEGAAYAGTPNGTIPANPPKESETVVTVEAKDDGIKEGTVIYSASFESGLGGWGYQTNNSKEYVTESIDKATDGKVSIRIVDEGEGIAPGIKSENIPVTEGNTYTFTLDAFVASGTMKMFVKYYDNNGAQLTNKSTNIAVGSWQAVSYSEAAPANATSAQVVVCGIGATSGDIYVDNVKVTKGKIKPVVKDKDFVPPVQTAPVNASLVQPIDNKLVYTEYNENGDKLGDFSYGGFYAGDYELPVTANLPVVAELSPSGKDDDTAMIQDTIEKVYNESPDDTMKVIKLKAGTYNISKKGLSLRSGIILSGEGQGPTGTILYAKDAVQHTVVRISGNTPSPIGDYVDITDEYVKAGSTTINIASENTSKFKVGDTIVIYHPSTKKWAEAIDMVNIINVNYVDTSWGENNVDMHTERTITAINGTEITLDFPLYVPLIKNLTQSYIYKIGEEEKIQNSGIENLRIVSYYNGDPTDENHATVAINVTNAKNIFVRDVSAKHFYGSLISCGRKAKQITVLNCSNLDPVSKVAGSRRYSFACTTSAQQLLYTGCYSYAGRHDFETSFTVTGPIAFVDDVVDSSYGGIETHGTWSTGILYDNVYSVANDTVASIGFKNHGVYGSSASQGWTGATAVAWNCLAPAIIIHNPPAPYMNFMVGSWGIYKDEAGIAAKQSNIERYIPIYRTTKYNSADVAKHFATKQGSPFVGDGYAENEFTPVEPRSLFKAQLSERYTGTIANARPNAPIIINPKCDKETEEKAVTVSGISQLGATKVTVYIDNNAYDAPIDSDNSFSVTANVTEGVHKIYATQTINGMESTKTADRFITVGKANGNPEYLQSVYSPDKTRLIVNDPRPTYDEYEKTIKSEMASGIKVIVNGARLVSDVEPFETQGRVLVPMRAIFEALDAKVSWDAETFTATAVKEEITVKITENQTVAYVNNNPVTLDVPATIVNGRFVVPVRFISESFGALVGWIDARRTVTVEGGGIRYKASHDLDGELDLANVIQSGDDGTGATIVNVTDNDYSSKWGVLYDAANPDGAYGIFDLGKSKDIASMYIAFSAGDKRVYTVDILISDDNVNYTPVKTGHKSSGTTAQFEEIPLNVKARYVKLVGKKNSVNDWLNLQEVAFTGK